MAYRFEFKKKLGAGYFGEVWLAKDVGLNVLYALKCIPQNKIINQNNFFQEAQALKIAEHPNIVQVKDTGQLSDGRIYVAMEYLRRGSLEDKVKGAFVPLSRAKVLMMDVLRGLENAHSKGIVHRDIKPANILIGDADEGKLSDFGLALPDFSALNLSVIKQQYQYWMHLAPEVDSFTDYTYLSDIYACGVTLYRLINGDSFLPRLNFHEMRAKSKNGTFPNRKKYRDFIPKPMKIVINKALSIEPSNRYQSAQEMRHALEKVRTDISWKEERMPNGIVWISRTNGLSYAIRRVHDDKNQWSVEVKKGKSKNNLRRVSAYCHYNLSNQEAKQKAKKILQDFVLGKIE